MLPASPALHHREPSARYPRTPRNRGELASSPRASTRGDSLGEPGVSALQDCRELSAWGFTPPPSPRERMHEGGHEHHAEHSHEKGR